MKPSLSVLAALAVVFRWGGFSAAAFGWIWEPSMVLVFLQENPGLAPLPASPPIGGTVWTVAVPAVLFIGSFLGTFLLYRRFSRKEEEGPEES